MRLASEDENNRQGEHSPTLSDNTADGGFDEERVDVLLNRSLALRDNAADGGLDEERVDVFVHGGLVVGDDATDGGLDEQGVDVLVGLTRGRGSDVGGRDHCRGLKRVGFGCKGEVELEVVG